jgi:hypothetical protein
MDHVSLILSKVLRRRGLAPHADAAQVAHTARQWLHAKLSDHRSDISVSSFKEGTLTIGCTHSIAAQECQSVGHELLEFLRQEMPKIVFSSIRIVRSSPLEAPHAA